MFFVSGIVAYAKNDVYKKREVLNLEGCMLLGILCGRGAGVLFECTAEVVNTGKTAYFSQFCDAVTVGGQELFCLLDPSV